MFIVVTNDKRVPSELDGFQKDQWTADEFIARATSDDGIEVDEGIWYDVSVITPDVYEGLKQYEAANVLVVYYRFSDVPEPSFPIENVKVIEASQPEPEPMPEPEPIPEPVIQEVTPEPEPVVEPEPEPEPVVQQAPIVPEPVVQPRVEPVVQPVQQPVVQPEMRPGNYQPQPQPAPQPAPQPQVNPYYQPSYPQQFIPQPAPQAPVAPAPAPQSTSMFNQQPALQKTESLMAVDKPVDVTKIKFKLDAMLQDDGTKSYANKNGSAKVILFGSSKGGTGKTFTALISAYYYAKTHPNQKVALADFDIIDGQIGITINKLGPTLQDYYKNYIGGNRDFSYLNNVRVRSDHFSSNIDFYLAPAQDIPEITENTTFWIDVFKQLLSNYDVVFFDSGIDYLGKAPISMLYKLADRIILTCNPSINSVKSVVKQLTTLCGTRRNNVFNEKNKILDKCSIVLTRVYNKMVLPDGTVQDNPINDLVVGNLTKYAPVIATFGNIDNIISQVQWYQRWHLIDENADIIEQLERIVSMEETEDE